MKTKFLNLIMLTILFTVGVSSCSNDEPNPEDYVTSILSGDYGKGAYHLYVTENGEAIEVYGHVRFTAKDIDVKAGDFIFVDILPGESKKEFKDVPMTSTEEGLTFSISYTKNGKSVSVKGTIDFGQMTIDINY